MRGIISRFAPAPTGFLHLGHIVNAVYVWGVAGAVQGRVLLRIEDHDRARSRPEFEAAILEDLAWLGFTADELLVRQSARGDIYSQARSGLIPEPRKRPRGRGLVYDGLLGLVGQVGRVGQVGQACPPTCPPKRGREGGSAEREGGEG